jgi:RNA polymerase sigma-70 factor (ECF subfamily)
VRTNEEWLRALQGEGGEQEAALKELRDLLFRAIRAQLIRWGGARDAGSGEQRAEDYAQEALLLVLDKLGTFRGESRFTTWAYTISFRLVLADLRRRRWHEVSLDQASPDGNLPAWPIEERSPNPERALHQEQLWQVLREVIDRELTDRQRSALVAAAFQGMPLDVVAERLDTNRDNVYKLIHDARRRLKRSLAARGLTAREILATFAPRG